MENWRRILCRHCFFRELFIDVNSAIHRANLPKDQFVFEKVAQRVLNKVKLCPSFLRAFMSLLVFF